MQYNSRMYTHTHTLTHPLTHTHTHPLSFKLDYTYFDSEKEWKYQFKEKEMTEMYQALRFVKFLIRYPQSFLYQLKEVVVVALLPYHQIMLDYLPDKG